MTISEMIVKAEAQEMQYSKYGNGQPAPYKRFIEDGKEYTLIGADGEAKRLYVGEEGATVTLIKEGRREDNLEINGEAVKFASLVANNIRSANDYFECC